MDLRKLKKGIVKANKECDCMIDIYNVFYYFILKKIRLKFYNIFLFFNFNKLKLFIYQGYLSK